MTQVARRSTSGRFGFSGVSPDGKQLSLVGFDPDGELRIFVVRTDGSHLRAVTPTGMPLSDIDGGSWSPNGNWIAFTARSSPDNRFTIWMVHPDGNGLHRLHMTHCGDPFDDPESRGCLNPDWAPDGRRIAFDQFFPADAVRNIYTAKPDGSDIRQVTTGTELQEQEPDWGVAPPAP